MPAGEPDRPVAVWLLALAPVGGLALLLRSALDGDGGMALKAGLALLISAALLPYVWRRDFKSDDDR